MYSKTNIRLKPVLARLAVSVYLYFSGPSVSLGQLNSGQPVPDSAVGKAHAGFDHVSKIHRTFFGENYRKEWSVDTKLPVIHLSVFHGGLTAVKQGGGNQTHSLRLVDKNGMEWVLRSVEKYPESILPENLRHTFLKDIVTDAMSAQHPYSALFVPVVAGEVGVPHANPVVGIVAPDSALGIYAKIFEGTICLLEEREPTGKSVSYFDMLDKLNADNDNSFDSATFLRARILDVFLGDWDRHKDQWRFRPGKTAYGFKFTGVPRDRDQVFYTNQGFFPYLESRSFVQPFFEGFNPKIRKVGTLLYSSTLLNIRFLNQFSYDEWMRITNEFVAAVTDSVLKHALAQLPASSRDLGYEKLLKILQSRRADLPRAMSEYYYFLNKNVFIQTSNQNELFLIGDTAEKGMSVRIFKLSQQGERKQELFSKVYDPEITKEIRFFTMNGNDQMIIDNHKTPIRLRFSGVNGIKKYDLIAAEKKVRVYNKSENISFEGNTGGFCKHLSDDSLNTAIKPGNLFNAFAPILTGGYNPDDGILLGVSLSFYRGLDYSGAYSTKKYSGLQQFSFMHAFATSAFNAKYRGEWLNAIGKADIIVQASIFAPDNTQNFFGTGNETAFTKSGDFVTYYRSRFDHLTFTPSLRWVNKIRSSISVGPSIQYYTYDSADNVGRFISSPGAVQTYDSNTLSESKFQAGLVADYNLDRRDGRLLPEYGYGLHMKVLAYGGLNKYAKSYGQWYADFVFYKTIDNAGSLVLANRTGGGATVGNATFYQSMFLGGQGNLLGYRQYRYAGQYMAYNNLELRLRLFQFANYILPGQLGVVGLFDIGRVWQKEDHSNQWHNGVGAGIYFAPAQIALVQLVVSYSTEGWYPALTFGFRF